MSELAADGIPVAVTCRVLRIAVLLTGDRTIHSEVTDRQLYERLHQYVEK